MVAIGVGRTLVLFRKRNFTSGGILKQSIAKIPAEMLHRVIENWRKRVEIGKRSRSGHLANNLLLS